MFGATAMLVLLALLCFAAVNVALAIVGVGLLYLAFRQSKKPAHLPLVAVVTNRRVIAFRGGGSDEIQLSKVETISTDREGVVLSGSGGTKLRVGTTDPDGVRNSIQRALAEHIK